MPDDRCRVAVDRRSSTEPPVVEEMGDGLDDYAFGYTVTGVRRGFEDQEVVGDGPAFGAE